MSVSVLATFAYDFFNEQYNRLATDHDQPSVITSSRAAIETSLLFDPGEQWKYGSNIDWAGQVVEGVAGKPLGDVFAERIFAPLGMTDSAFTMTPAMRERLATMHQRGADGIYTPLADFELPQAPEVQMGGHALYSTPLDYAKFIRMWLNDGDGPGGRVLLPETVRMAEATGLGEMKIKGLPGVIPSLSNYAEFFPGMAKSWALTFMVNDADAPTGRPARPGGTRQPLLLDRPAQRYRRLLGHANPPLRRPALGRGLPRVRDGGLRRDPGEGRGLIAGRPGIT